MLYTPRGASTRYSTSGVPYACTLGAPCPLRPPSSPSYRSLSFSPRSSGSPSGRAPGESERIPWPPGPRPTNTFSRREICESVEPETDRRRRVSVCFPIAAGDSRNEETSVWPPPPPRRNARPGPRAPDRDPERRVSISLSPIRHYDHLSDMYLAYLIARVRPSLSLVSRSIAAGAAFYARALTNEGGIGAVKNERVQPGRRDYATPATRW